MADRVSPSGSGSETVRDGLAAWQFSRKPQCTTVTGTPGVGLGSAAELARRRNSESGTREAAPAA
eukprot:602541-Hanusia_phi.AAC.1